MSNTADIPESWLSWIVHNLQRGCSRQSMLESMMRAQIQETTAIAWIARVADLLSTEAGKQYAKAAYQYEASKLAPGNFIRLNDCTVRVALRLARPDIALFSGFMSDEECETMISLAKQKLLPSTIVDPQSGSTRTMGLRSSTGAYFQRGENDLVRRLERRISELMNWPVEKGEGMQVLNYSVGSEYKAHFDYFPPQHPGSQQHLAIGGQRIATLVMYLNDVARGGETIFPEIGLSVAPQRGSAVYFAYGNSLGQLDPASLHAGAPVLDGEKWIATKWVRQHQYGGA